ncbi:MAG TPA: hypothetical protein VFI84_01545 [Candidatus Saccharimonadales bacterium]|nr:hypothetical protein [Candidatus Saccharimonadales bacterium]
MNPQFDKSANLNLPPPMPESSGPAPYEAPEGGARPVEAVPAAPERQLQPAAPALPAIPAQQQTQQGQTATNVAPSTTTNSTALPQMADDADLIEKEWVNKAKEIIAKTQDDPYKQSKEITYMKSDYLQKRYNKAIKLSE